jgi:hypothetical protein
MNVAAAADPAAFIARWQKSGAAERANYQLFLSELCDLLGVPRRARHASHESSPLSNGPL